MTVDDTVTADFQAQILVPIVSRETPSVHRYLSKDGQLGETE